MSYGSTAYGSAALGGSAASEWQVFLPYQNRVAGDYEARGSLTGDGQFYSVFLLKSSENTDVSVAVFTYNDPGETPQAQGVFGGSSLQAQFVIGRAQFVVVRATLGQSELIRVSGRPGD